MEPHMTVSYNYAYVKLLFGHRLLSYTSNQDEWVSMNKQQVHQYVLEQISGTATGRQEAKKLLVYSFAVAAAAAVIVLATDPTNTTVIVLAISTLFAGIPFGVASQRITLGMSLSRKQLRLTRFLIGKKGYLSPKDHVMHDHADLFAIASNLVCHDKFLAPGSSAAAWHTYGLLHDSPSIAAYTGWYGDNQPVIFLYGDVKELTALTTDVWDLGHIRTMTKTDHERFAQTAAGWKRQQLLPIALAYAPLPPSADPAQMTISDLAKNCTLLGAIGVTGSLGEDQQVVIAPAEAVRRATAAQVVITLSLVFYAGLSAIFAQVFNQAPVMQAVHLIVFSLFLSPLLLAVYSWDRPPKVSRKQPFASLLWASILIAVISFGAVLLYRYSVSSLNVTNQLLVESSMSAVGVLTLGLCLLAQLIASRTSGKLVFKPAYNPLFLLACSSGLLLVLIAAYTTGPVLLGGAMLAIGASLTFCAVHELKTYADRHHTREHIVELLKNVAPH